MALAGIHASRAMARHQLDSTREKAHFQLFDESTPPRARRHYYARKAHGKAFEDAPQMVKAYTFFLEKRLTMEEREDGVEDKEKRRPSSPVVEDL